MMAMIGFFAVAVFLCWLFCIGLMVVAAAIYGFSSGDSSIFGLILIGLSLAGVYFLGVNAPFSIVVATGGVR